jgi:hypothetical protein
MTSRGAYEGGQQERRLAQRFDDYALALEVSPPKWRRQCMAWQMGIVVPGAEKTARQG